MKIAIPTHRRSDIINNLTLNLLRDIEPSSIYLFISDEHDLELYKSKCIGNYNFILCHTTTATEKFNFIQSYFEEGQFVVVIEDDIKQVQSLVTNDISKILKFIYNFCFTNGIKSFGVYPSSNKFFMKKTIDVGFTYIVANMFGFVATKNKNLLCSMKSKTDYERSVLFYHVLGNIARFNFVACITNNYSNKGGMQDMENRAGAEREASLTLCKLYPTIFSINHGRKSKYTELKMNKNIKYTIKL